MLGVVFVLLGLVIDLDLGVFSDRIGDWLRRRESIHWTLDRVVGMVIGALGVRLLISGRHT